MASLVFDACALVAFAYDEEGADRLETYLASEENTCFVHSLNFCEFYYQAYRRSSKQDAVRMLNEFLDLGLILRDDMDIDFWQDAGELKAIHKKVSVADCCAIALAKRLDADLVTSDHHELDALADLGVCKITFFR